MVVGNKSLLKTREDFGMPYFELIGKDGICIDFNLENGFYPATKCHYHTFEPFPNNRDA
jgi:hypothetical protein